MRSLFRAVLALPLLFVASSSQAQNLPPTPTPTPSAPPLASDYVFCAPRHRVVEGSTMVPLNFASQSL